LITDISNAEKVVLAARGAERGARCVGARRIAFVGPLKDRCIVAVVGGGGEHSSSLMITLITNISNAEKVVLAA